MARRHKLHAAVAERDHAIGPADARVTVVEYGDFECPFCGQAAPGIHLMLRRYARQVRFVFRHFPLDVHPHAVVAAEAAECAAVEGKFWPMHDLLYRRQAELARIDLDRYAREIGLDQDRYALDMDDHAHLARIDEDRQSGWKSGVHATPVIFVNGRMLDVEFDLQTLYDAIDTALA